MENKMETTIYGLGLRVVVTMQTVAFKALDGSFRKEGDLNVDPKLAIIFFFFNGGPENGSPKP